MKLYKYTYLLSFTVLFSCDSGSNDSSTTGVEDPVIVEEARVEVIANDSFLITSPQEDLYYLGQRYTFPSGVSKYFISFEIKGSNLFDSDHEMMMVMFTPNEPKSFSFYDVQSGGMTTSPLIGSEDIYPIYRDDALYRVESVVDLKSDLWTLSIDGVEIGSSQFLEDEIVTLDFRFGAQGHVQDLDKSVEVSNLNISVILDE